MPCPETPGCNWRGQLAAISSRIARLADWGVPVPDLAGLLRRFSDPRVGPIPAEFKRDRDGGPAVEFVPVEESAVERQKRRQLDRDYEEITVRLRGRFRLTSAISRPSRMPWERFNDDEIPA